MFGRPALKQNLAWGGVKQPQEREVEYSVLDVVEPARQYIFEDGANIFAASAQEPTQFPSMLRAPAILTQSDGGTILRTQVLIDSGCNASSISREVVEQQGWKKMKNREGIGTTIKLPDGSTLKPHGRVALTMLFGKKRINHTFYIVESPAETMFIGLDLFPQLGIFVGGLPTAFADSDPGGDLAARATAAEEPLRDRPRPWTVEDMVAEGDRKKLLDAVAPLLAANASIPPTAVACPTLPEAVMHLPMPARVPHQLSFRRQYPIALKAMDAVEEKVRQWDAAGITVPAPATSNFNSPILATPKKSADGARNAWRVCLDFRGPNQLLTSEAFANQRMPVLSDVLRHVAGFKYASLLDLKEAYHGMLIAEEDRQKTTFRFKGRARMFRKWPFGLRPASSQFQAVMTHILEGIEGIVIWVDDIAICTKGTFADHIATVQEVIRRLTAHNMRLNQDKCHFGFKKILLLGHFLSGTERSVDPAKAHQLIDWPIPKTGRDVRRFLGFCNFLRDYVINYSTIAAPLETMRQLRGALPPNAMKPGSAARQAFHALVESINRSPCLSQLDPELPLEVATDASQYGVGAVLYQTTPEGRVKYVAFSSQALHGSQKHYSATKRELLGVIAALRHFDPYLRGQRFTLYTDHAALTSLFTSTPSTSHVFMDWLQVLLEYDFDVRHLPGLQNVMPDALSRLSEDQQKRHDIPAMLSALIAPEAGLAGKHATAEAPAGAKLRIDELPASNPEKLLLEFIKERHLKSNIVGAENRLQYLRDCHAYGHFGADALFKAVWRNGFWWPGLRKQCGAITSTCKACLQHNIFKEGFHPIKSQSSREPWDQIAIDCIGDLPTSSSGMRYVLVMVDVATRFIVAKALPDLKAETVARALYETFAVFGPCQAMTSDNGPEFINKVVAKLAAAAGVDHRTVAPFNPRANGLAERCVQAVSSALKKKIAGAYDHWDQALPGVVFAINTKDAALSKTPPFTSFFGRPSNGWHDYVLRETYIRHGDPETDLTSFESEEIEQTTIKDLVHSAKEQRQTAENDKRNERRRKGGKLVQREFPPGSFVMIVDPDRRSKTDPRNYGPFMVVRKSKRSATYTLANPFTMKTLDTALPVSQLKWIADFNVQLSDAEGNPLPQPDGSVEQERAEVDLVLDVRSIEGQQEFKVRWKGYPQERDSWVKKEDFDSDKSIADYWKAVNPGKQRAPGKTARKRQAALQGDESAVGHPAGKAKKPRTRPPQPSRMVTRSRHNRHDSGTHGD